MHRSIKHALTPFAFSLPFLFVPLIGWAQQTFADIVGIIITSILDPLVSLLVGIALAIFIWGVIKFISHAGDETKRADGIKMMTYGIIGLFVIVSVWGLVTVLQNTFFGPGGSPVPVIPFPGTGP